MIHCDCKIDNVYSKWTDEILDVNMAWCPLHGAAGELLEACRIALARGTFECEPSAVAQIKAAIRKATQ